MTVRGTIKAGIRTARVAYKMRQVARADGEDAQLRAREQLAALLGRIGGVSAKLGQTLGMRGHGEEFERLGSGVEPLPLDAVLQQIEKRLGTPHQNLFQSIDPRGLGASFGQVHRATTLDGRDVAIKVRYPGIRAAVQDEFRLLKALPKPTAMRRVGFDLVGMQRSLESTLIAELDYEAEADRQEAYARSCTLTGLKVPTVYRDLCGEGILTQSFENGLSLRDIATAWTPRERARCADILLRHFLRRYFVDGPLHADPHAGNYLFRKSPKGDPTVVLLDFGSIAEGPQEERTALLRLFLATERRESIDPVECFLRMGFDSEKLEPISHRLPALAKILFEPFLCDQPIAVAEWRAGPRIRDLLGDLSWWFRAAAPPTFLLTLRAWAGLLSQVDTLGVRPRWQRALRAECGTALAAAQAIELPQAASDRASCSTTAQTLTVRVSKHGREKVSVTLPARVLDRITDVIESDVVQRIESQGVDIEAITHDVRAQGYPIGVVFDVTDNESRYLIKLE